MHDNNGINIMSKIVNRGGYCSRFVLSIVIIIVLIYLNFFFSFPVLYENNILISDGGNGTSKNPIRIANEEQFASFRDSVNAGWQFQGIHIVLTNDLDLSAYDPWNPIGITGSNGRFFYGTLDARGHTISNLNCAENELTTDNGLFGTLAGTVINLGIESGDISGSCAGSIAAHGNGEAKIINCYSYADVTGTAWIGGLVDDLTDGFLENVFYGGNVEGGFGSATICAYSAASITKAVSKFPQINANVFEGNYKNNEEFSSLKQSVRFLNDSRAEIAAKYKLPAKITLNKWVIYDGRLALKKS